MSEENSREFKAGDTFRAIVPFSSPESIKVHIDYVLPSKIDKTTLLIYRVFGKHKRWWHELMCDSISMEHYINWYELRKQKEVKNDQ